MDFKHFYVRKKLCTPETNYVLLKFVREHKNRSRIKSVWEMKFFQPRNQFVNDRSGQITSTFPQYSEKKVYLLSFLNPSVGETEFAPSTAAWGGGGK